MIKKICSMILVFSLAAGMCAYATPLDMDTLFALDERSENSIQNYDKTDARTPDGERIYSSENIPEINLSHPRVYVNPQIITQIKERVNSPVYQTAWENIKSRSDMDHDGTFPPVTASGATNFSYSVVRAMSAAAFRYLVQGDEYYGNKAVTMMKNALKSYVYPFTDQGDRDIGDLLYASALTYDWCYDLMTAQERMELIPIFKQYTNWNCITYPPEADGTGSVTGHKSEQHLLRDSIALGIAIYDEAPEYWEEIMTSFLDYYVPARDFVYSSLTYNQGNGYGPFRGQFDHNAAFLLDRIGYENVMSKDHRFLAYAFLYQRTPDGHMLRDGDMNDQTFGNMFAQYPQTLLYTASYYNDGYLMDAAYRLINQEGKNFIDLMASGSMAEEFMLLFDESVERKSIENLPLTMFYESPVGGMVARSNWGNGIDSNVMIANVKMGEYFFSNHTHSDAGKFDIYFKGYLGVDSGVYQGSDGAYFSNHDKNWHKRSIAHNTIVVYDPEEYWGTQGNTEWKNDGGQNMDGWRTEPQTLELLLTGDYKKTDTLKEWSGPNQLVPDFSYIKGDLTDAYHENKMEEFLRSFVFLNYDNNPDSPGAVIVYDKVKTTKPEYEKFWLLHMPAEPEVNGDMTTVEFTSAGYNGKMFNKTLIPEQSNAVIEKVEGYNVFGTEYSNKPYTIDGATLDETPWHIQVSPRCENDVDYFLNVIQVSDAGVENPPYEAVRVDTKLTHGVKINDRYVLFGKASELIGEAVDVVIDEDKTYKVLVCDLEPGVWTLYKDGEAIGQKEVEEGSSTFNFEGGKGSYKLVTEDKGLGEVEVSNRTEATPVQSRKRLVVNLRSVDTDVEIDRTDDGTTMIPFRSVLEDMQGEVSYDEATALVAAKTEFAEISLKEGERVATVNGKEVEMKAAPYTKDGRLMVEMNFLAEALFGTANWYEYANAVYMTLREVPRDQWAIESVVADGPNNDGTDPQITLDNDLTTYWAGDIGCWLKYDLGEVRDVGGVGVAWHQGSARVAYFKIYVSEDGENWTMAFDGESSGKTAAIEKVTFEQSHKARYVKLEGHGNSKNNWCSVREFVVYKPVE